jgi:hypothetical protein
MVMEHAETLERIEIAAVEPGGLARLTAGDTPEAAAVAGHLAGCPACVAELARIGRTATLAREAIGSLPDPALRERTLSFVRAVGRDRSAIAAASADSGGQPLGAMPSPFAPTPSVAAPAPVPLPVRAPGGLARRRSGRLGIFAGLAAALIVASLAGFSAAGALRAPAPANRDAEVAVLATASEATIRIEGKADATRVTLTSASGGRATGTLLFSPSSGELVMVASGLAPVQAGQEYGCWVQVNGVKHRIGRMYTGGAIQAWAGPVDGLTSLPPGTVFGVSLVSTGGGASQPVLTGGL